MDSVTKQWDLSITAIASADKLYAMMRAVSEDNVQGQAILAIMALGSGLSVNDELIGTGIDALGGRKNVNLQNLKLAVGLFSGGTSSVLRLSTPGVKVFLLLVGLKMWQSDEDIGDILYNMAISTGVMKTYPASGYQFAQVVSALSGYAASILPAQHLHTVGERIMSFCNSGPGLKMRPRLCELVSTKSVADILTAIFTGLQNKEINRISLHGDVSGIWIVALLTWLLPDETCVQLDSQLIMGTGNKLLIQLSSQKKLDGDCNWNLVEWREERSFQSLIECPSLANCSPGTTVGGYRALDRMSNSGAWVPWTTCKFYIQSAMNIPPDVVALVGQLAGSLLQFIVEEGRIHSHSYGDEDGICSIPNSTATILDVSGDFFASKYGSLMLEFGWSKEDLQNGVGKLAVEFKRLLSIAEPPVTFPLVEKAMTEAMMSIDKAFNHPRNQVLQDAIAMAMQVATEALALLTYLPPPGETGGSHVPVMSFTIYRQREEMLRQIISVNGMDVHDFRQNLLKIITSRDIEMTGDELILESNGIVIVPAILLTPSPKQNQTLGLHLIPGIIKKEGHRYIEVREKASGLFSKGRSDRLQLFNQGNYCGELQKAISKEQRPELDVFTTIKGQVIYVRSVITFRPPNTLYSGATERDLRWLRAIETLATAKHLGRLDQLSPRAEETLARRLFENGALEDAFWIEPFSGEGNDYVHSRTRLVACTSNNELLRVYQASVSRNCIYVIQHEAPLVKSIAIASETSNDWIIIS